MRFPTAFSLAVLALGAGSLLGVAPALAEDGGVPVSDQQIGKHFEVPPGELPQPNPREAVANVSGTVARDGRTPIVPQGFKVSLFASDLASPRQLLVLPGGDVLLAQQGTGDVTLLRDADGDGEAEHVKTFASGFDEPYGLAYRDGEVLIADLDGIWKVSYQPGKGGAPKVGDREAVTDQGVFDGSGGHSTRSLAIDPKDGTLYAGVGSAENIGIDKPPRATIQAFDEDGSSQRTFASGLRNPVGVGFNPVTGALWTVVNERDGQGDRLVPDYFTHVKKGAFYGWPYSYIGSNPQPGYAGKAPDKVKSAVVPDLLFEAHSAPLDFVFYTGTAFPKSYTGDAFVTLHGSWNRGDPTGYKVVHVPFKDGKPAGGYDNFMTGFWVEGTNSARVWGRPASIAVTKDGALLVADDTGGTIWKVTYAGGKAAEKSDEETPQPGGKAATRDGAGGNTNRAN